MIVIGRGDAPLAIKILDFSGGNDLNGLFQLLAIGFDPPLTPLKNFIER